MRFTDHDQMQLVPREKRRSIVTGREQQCVWVPLSDRDNDETQTKTH